MRDVNKTYHAVDVAAYLVLHAKEKNIGDMTHLKIQKLVYLAHGWFLGIFEERLIKEDIEAWQYGPVVSELYDELKIYGSAVIPFIESKITIEGYPKDMLNRILDVYGNISGSNLVEITHEPGTPWYEITNAGKIIVTNLLIPTRLIQEYFQERKA